MECRDILKELSILYVEDEDDIREMLRDVLKKDFKRFVIAKNGKEGLEKFQENGFDIVITDIEMPIMDGMSLAKEIKKISKCVPVILLTAHSQKERLFLAIDIGVNKYLVKPFTPDKLLDEICRVAKEYLQKDKILRLNDNLYFDQIRRELLSRDKKAISLTKKELEFLELLIKNRNRVVTTKEISNIIWKDEAFTEAALRALVKRVRQKTSKELIKNFPGIGYKLIANNKNK